jgi:membrane protein
VSDPGTEEPSESGADRADADGSSAGPSALDRARRRIDPATSVLRDVAARGSDAQVGFLAAAIAHYAFVSLLPLLLFVLAVGTYLGGEALARAVVDRVGGLLAPSGQELFTQALTSPVGRGPAGLVGLLGVLWGTLKVFRGLDLAFSRLYGTASEKSFLGGLRNAVVVLASVGLGVAGVVAVVAAVAVVDGALAVALAPLTLFVTLLVVFFPLYYVFPDVPVSPRRALPGTVLAAVGWTLLAAGFGFYTSVAGSFALYGVLGAVLLLVTWLYLGALVVLAGGLLNVALDDRAPVGTGSYKSHASDGPTE